MSENETQLEPSFAILGQGIRDLSFENLVDFTDDGNEQPEINIGIEADGKKIHDDTYEVILRIKASANVKKGPLFILELDYMSLCKIQNVPDDMISGLLMIQTPALMFPFARQIISDTTSNAGFPPLLLQPVDFAALYHNNQKANTDAVGHA